MAYPNQPRLHLLYNLSILNRRATEKYYFHFMTEKILDATGLICPLPVLKLRKHLKSMRIGDIVLVVANDPAAAIDIPHFCNEAGHTLISQQATGSDATQYQIRKEI